MQVTIRDRNIGEDAPCYLVFEAGPTHSGVESAKRLVRLAAQSGADAIKFQIFDPDRLVADKKLMFTYQVLVDRSTERLETVSEPLYDILCRRCLSGAEWREVKRECDALNLAFFATVGFSEDVELLQQIGCDSIKIASSDVNHYPLLRQVARTGLCVQIDTGSATLGEIEAAIDVMRFEGNERIIIHHCPSGYPARLPSINLRVIPTLQRMFPYPVAFSDHTPGWEMDIAALSLGAKLLEKTITEDRTTRSVEHVFSLDPPDMTRFIGAIRDLETALGNTRRIFGDEERKNRNLYRRSTYIVNGASAGQKLADVAVDFRRPGTGVSPDWYEKLQDKTFRRDVVAGELLSLGDLE
jgi:N,N'-diacetyllegionaminate synthase